MADGFDDLFDEGATVEVDEDILSLKIYFDKIFLNCYNTPEGKRMFDTMRERFVDVPIYQKGNTLEATSYRQGMADVVLMMESAVEDAVNPPQKQ